MPIFEYRCEECSHVTEFVEDRGERGEHRCEECGSVKTARALSVFNQGRAPAASACPTGGCCPGGTCGL